MLVKAIAAYIGIPPAIVEQLGRKAPLLYRRYSVKKKSGGQRMIFHPAKETKTLQGAAVDLLDSPDLYHDCVRGYIRGLKSPLLSNANAHCKQQFLLRLDISDFFPSIKPDDFTIVCGKRIKLNGEPLSKQDLDFLSELFFVWNKTLGWFLGIGAPSSPFVSNWVMFDIDKKIMSLCEDSEVTYTRYADDLLFSANSKVTLLDVEKGITPILESFLHPCLTLNTGKRYLGSKWSRRRVTGLTITPTGAVKVPRAMKRLIRSMLYKLQQGVLSIDDKSSLSGYLAFMNDCEPAYFNNLVLKYGSDTVRNALKKR